MEQELNKKIGGGHIFSCYSLGHSAFLKFLEPQLKHQIIIRI